MTDQQPSSGDPLRSGDPLGSPHPAPAPGVDLGKDRGTAPAWGEPPSGSGSWGSTPGAGPGQPAGGWAPPAQQEWGQAGTSRPPGWSNPTPGPGAASETPVGLILGIVALAVGFFGFFVAGPFVVLLALPLSVAGWIVSGRELGRDPQNGPARAGKIVGIVGVVLSILAVVITVLVLGVLVALISADGT